jgi:hypothetical protein
MFALSSPPPLIIPFISCTIQGTVVDLALTIYGHKTQKVSAYIFLPPSYPQDTMLGLKYKGRTIFTFSFTVQNQLSSARHDKLIKAHFNVNDTTTTMYMYIDELYFYPKTANVPLTQEEQDIFRGVGKRAAKIVLDHYLPLLPLPLSPPTTTIVCLEASGTIRSRRQQDERERELEKSDTTHLLALVAQHGILDMVDFYNNLSAPVMAQFKTGRWRQWPRCDWLNYLLPPLLYAEDNALLAKYYHRNFAMDIIDDTHKISQIFMATTLDKMLQAMTNGVL